MRVSISTTQQPVSVPAVAAATTTTTTTTTTATTTVDSGVSTGPILAPAPKTYKPRRHTKSITEERAIKIYTGHYCTPPPPGAFELMKIVSFRSPTQEPDLTFKFFFGKGKKKTLTLTLTKL